MASSIHIAKGHAGSVAHNSRDTPTKNAIFSDEKNECSLDTKSAFQIYRDELQLRTVAYTQNTGQKLQSKTITHLSSVVNLEAHHTLYDLKPLVAYLEKTLDTKVFQVAIHRDEGHVNDDMKDVKNYHAHIEFMGLDTNGASVRKKLTKKYLSDLQTETAKILGMERGRNYAKEQAPRPKRLDTYEFKDYKQREAQTIKSKVVTIEELKETIKTLRAELKERGAVRSDYAALEQLNKELKVKVEAKDLTIQELENTKKSYIKAFREILPEVKNEKEVVKYVKTLKNELESSKKALKVSKYEKTVLKPFKSKYELLNNTNKILNNQNLIKDKKIESLENKLKTQNNNNTKLLEYLKIEPIKGVAPQKQVHEHVQQLEKKVSYLESMHSENSTPKQQSEATKEPEKKEYTCVLEMDLSKKTREELLAELEQTYKSMREDFEKMRTVLSPSEIQQVHQKARDEQGQKSTSNYPDLSR